MTDLRKKLPCTISVLGANYRIEIRSKDNDERLTGSAYCSQREHLIVIEDESRRTDGWTREMLNSLAAESVRHEVLHAYLYESGLFNDSSSCSAWSENEEMVDWFAIQSPKIFKTYKELGVL